MHYSEYRKRRVNEWQLLAGSCRLYSTADSEPLISAAAPPKQIYGNDEQSLNPCS